AVSSYVESETYSGIELFVRAIPFNYYSLMTLLFVVLIIVFKVDYGPMAIHERNAIEKGDLFTTGVSTNKADEKLEENDKGKVMDLVIPVVALILICIFAMVYIGHQMLVADGETTMDNFDFIEAFGYTSAGTSLAWGGLVALVLTIAYLVIRRVISFKEAMECLPKGFNAMVPAMLILVCATSLNSMTGLLGADVFIEGLMDKASAGLALFLPAVIFIVAAFLAFSTGTSWGTFGILIPIVTVMFPEGSSLFFVGISACLAGAVCGDHCSPISDTTIMSSAGAQCDHINHVSTQLPYALSVAGCSFLGYIVGGLTQNGWIGLIVAAIATVGLVLGAKHLLPKMQKK
ncbi:MAG: Na+/H+ antiporter NhaC family protein, partial [Ruminococcaceae bacterium]|nr:Na+/H+ antiporter NhaC family protein [Oscillospiraceae bacterium]